MRFWGLWLLCGTFLFQSHICGSSEENPQTDFLPLFRLESAGYFFDDEAALVFLGDVGNELNRMNGSIGFQMVPHHNLKIGCDVLNESLEYHFSSKNARSWMRQYAYGLVYQTTFNCFSWVRSFDFSVQYSQVARHRIHNFHKEKHHHRDSHKEHHADTHPDHSQIHHSVHHHHHEHVYERVISGSRAFAYTAGATFIPFAGTLFSGAVTYDKVDYRLKFSKKKDAEGVGGLICWEQLLSPAYSFSARAEIRNPYNYFEGKINWKTVFYWSETRLGIFGGYVKGKNGLPSSSFLGVSLGFDFALTNFSSLASVGVCGDTTYPYHEPTWGQDPNDLSWLAKPAVYVPEVLALPEQRLVKRHEDHHSHRRHRR